MCGDSKERSAWNTSRSGGSLYFSAVGSELGKGDCGRKCAEIRWKERQASSQYSLHLLAKVWTQRERAVLIQPLVTSPANGIAHSFYLQFGFKFQSLPIREVGKHELRLPNLAR